MGNDCKKCYYYDDKIKLDPQISIQQSVVNLPHINYLNQKSETSNFCDTSTNVEKRKLFTYNNQNTYIGQWIGNKRNGWGKFIWKDGTYYEGYWKKDMVHGFGIFNYKDGRINGNWRCNQLHGFATLIQGKYKYEGFWDMNEKNGLGFEIYEDNSEFKGSFQKNQKNGFGNYKWEDGSTYEGDFLNDMFTGKGHLIIIGFYEYTGDFLNNYKHGYGLLINKVENEYFKFEGKFIYDKREKRGIFDLEQFNLQRKQLKQKGSI